MANVYLKSDLQYDRSRNLSGIEDTSVTNYNPTYGSSVTFSSEFRTQRQDDNYFFVHPKDVNSLNASFRVVFKENGQDAVKLVNELEKKGGWNPFNIKTDRSVYKDVYGYCDSYSVTHKGEKSFEINLDFNADEIPNLFNWKTKSYVNFPFVQWAANKLYLKNDVVYYGGLGTSTNKLNNFFYCLEDHRSSDSKKPNIQDSQWTQEFRWCPDANWQNSVSFDVTKFDSDFTQREKNRVNTAVFPIEYKFTAIDTKQLKAMLHFLESKGGYRRYINTIPSLYNRPKVLIAIEWTHTWLSCDTHSLTIKMIEDPLGAIADAPLPLPPPPPPINWELQPLNFPTGVAIDNNNIYWSEGGSPNKVGRADLDTSDNKQFIVPSASRVGQVAVDGSYIYWSGFLTNRVERADIATGANITIIVSGAQRARGVSVDDTHVYWTEYSAGNTSRIRKWEKSTSIVTNVATGLVDPNMTALFGNHIYWTDFRSGIIKRIEKSGANITDFITGFPLNGLTGIATDSNYVYFALQDFATPTNGKIQRADLLTGANITDVITGIDRPFAIAVNNQYLYWCDAYGGEVHRIVK